MSKREVLKKLRVVAEICKGATLAGAQAEACQLALAETVDCVAGLSGGNG